MMVCAARARRCSGRADGHESSGRRWHRPSSRESRARQEMGGHNHAAGPGDVVRRDEPEHAGHVDAVADAGDSARRPADDPRPPPLRPRWPRQTPAYGSAGPGRLRADRDAAQPDAEAGRRAVRGRAEPIVPGRALSQPDDRLRPGPDRLVLRVEADRQRFRRPGQAVAGRQRRRFRPVADRDRGQAAAQPGQVRRGGQRRALAGHLPGAAGPQRRPDRVLRGPRRAAADRHPSRAVPPGRGVRADDAGDGQRRPGQRARAAPGPRPRASRAAWPCGTPRTTTEAPGRSWSRWSARRRCGRSRWTRRRWRPRSRRSPTSTAPWPTCCTTAPRSRRRCRRSAATRSWCTASASSRSRTSRCRPSPATTTSSASRRPACRSASRCRSPTATRAPSARRCPT